MQTFEFDFEKKFELQTISRTIIQESLLSELFY